MHMEEMILEAIEYGALIIDAFGSAERDLILAGKYFYLEGD